MNLGILQTGHVPPALAGRHGEYPPMFVRMLGEAGPSLRFTNFDVVSGEMPESVRVCDAWLVTGSRFGVYDPEPWIPPLRDFLKNAYESSAPIIGVCFGHQILAEALGGEVIKSPKGWGVGVHSYEAADSPAWRGEIGPGRFKVRCMHQDQVIEKPIDARVIATSEFCEHAAFAYGDETAPKAISVQPHPEFTSEFVGELIRIRRSDVIPESVADAGLATLTAHVDNKRIAKWMVNFLRQAAQSA